MNCPLCKHKNFNLFHTDKKRSYNKCINCSLVFVPEEHRLSMESEKAEYDLHQNSPEDMGYRKFLSRIFNPVCELIKLDAKGLDFGSGPGPTLSVMFEEAGYDMEIFDIFYANNPDVLSNKYDFITCTEVVEHLFSPGEVLETLFSILNHGGIMGIMTKLVIDQGAFSGWHYITDQTHVCFFSRDTFQWIADKNGMEVDFIGKDVTILKKP